MGGVSDRQLEMLLDRRAALLDATLRDADESRDEFDGDELDGDELDGDELDEVTPPLADMMRSDALIVRRLTLDEPSEVLARLVAAEPVHPFRNHDDLVDRLDDDRRCFVLTHPALPDRPLNVVWIALSEGVATDLGAILDPSSPTADPTAADTAVFYSIWNVEPGLAGLPGGHILLAGAISALRGELTGLTTFVTLSPIPGLRSWIENAGVNADVGPPGNAVGPPLLAVCAQYLTTLDDQGRPIDPVARFHQRNGARLLSLAADADTSTGGLQRSFGIMANYRYAPEDLELNRAAFRDGRAVVGDQIVELLMTTA